MKVCIVAEGSYPIVRGGVSEWTHQLIQGLPLIDYKVFCLAPTGLETPIYERPKNVSEVIVRRASSVESQGQFKQLSRFRYPLLCDALDPVFHSRAIDCRRLVRLLDGREISKSFILSEDCWRYIVENYERMHQEADFSEFFWSARGLLLTLIDAINLARQVPQADVYHSLTTGLGGFVAAMAAAFNDQPLVISEHGMYLKERSIDLSRQAVTPETMQVATDYFVSLVRTSYAAADYLLPICRSYAENEVALGAPASKIRVVTNGIDVDKFTPPDVRHGGRPVVGCFARVVPLKDQLSLIRASKKVLESHQADFVFVGEIQDEDYYEECKALITELKVEEHVKFIGHSDNIADWYRKSDVFVLSSQTEGLPLALLEALSCGLPCVCTSVGGVPDVVSDTGVGYVVPPGDPDQLASSIAALLENESLRRSMGEKATKLVREKYTLQSMQQKINNVYLDALLIRDIQASRK